MMKNKDKYRLASIVAASLFLLLPLHAEEKTVVVNGEPVAYFFNPPKRGIDLTRGEVLDRVRAAIPAPLNVPLPPGLMDRK